MASVPEMDPASKPCYVKAKGMAGASYTRGGGGDRLLTAYGIFMLHANRGQPQDDHEVVAEAGPADLETDAVGRLLRRVRQREPQAFGAVDDETALVRLGVLRRSNSGVRVTLAGLLTLGQWPQQYVPQLCVTFIAVPGTHKDSVLEGAPRFTDNATIRGPLPQMIEETVRVILRNTRTAGYVRGLGRDYPVEALREAVTNALAHRDYSPMARGTQIQVEPGRCCFSTNPHPAAGSDGRQGSAWTRPLWSSPGSDASPDADRRAGLRAGLRLDELVPLRWLQECLLQECLWMQELLITDRQRGQGRRAGSVQSKGRRWRPDDSAWIHRCRFELSRLVAVASRERWGSQVG